MKNLETPKKRKRVYRVEFDVHEREGFGEDGPWLGVSGYKEQIKDQLGDDYFCVIKNLKIRRVKSWE